MIVLYQKGSKYGSLFNEFSFEHMLDTGEWFLSAEEALAAKDVSITVEKPKKLEKPKTDEYEEKFDKAVKETKEALDAVKDLKTSSGKKVSK
jgi:hypothetical protein